ncbi:heavy-metal-associated domain-containing protein [Daejeonella lutea]|uniref:Copper chaperone CopZ n=1 Tax=Daejeonella lutea TaxID=572036 RepID=A0A1T5DSX1_9SPHI|nr:heavy metal-associated domain-containing protein [Daejeonella lutea]SKB74922.1 Copper chaperone CopZ [Daejeonella lutea]
MKRYIIYAVTAILSFATSANAQFIKADVQVSGLTCSMCQLATEKALKTLDFVSDIKPDLNKNVYILTFKKDKNVNLDQIKSKVKGAGFSVSKLVATVNFNDVKVSNNTQYKFLGNTLHFVNVPSRNLNGTTRITLLDKGFIPDNTFKKNTVEIKAPGYKTGQVGGVRVYHVTI